MLFIVWFRSYTERFFALSEEEKSKVAPAPNAKPFSHSIANDHQKPANGTVNLEDVAGPKITKQRQFRVCEWTQEGGAVCHCDSHCAHRRCAARPNHSCSASQPSTSGVQFQPRVHVPDEVVSSPSMVLNSVTPDDRIEFEPNLLAPAASPSIDNGHFFDLVAPGLNNLVRRSSIALIFGSTPDPIHPPPRPRLSPLKPCEQLSYTTLVEPRLQPMREEAQRAFATFLEGRKQGIERERGCTRCLCESARKWYSSTAGEFKIMDQGVGRTSSPLHQFSSDRYTRKFMRTLSGSPFPISCHMLNRMSTCRTSCSGE